MKSSYALLPLISLAAAINCRFGLTYRGSSLEYRYIPNHPFASHQLSS